MKEKISVFFLITRSDTIGGASIHVLDIAKELKTKGHNVKVLVGGNGLLINYLEELKIEYIKIKRLKREISLINDILCIAEIVTVLKKHNLDILHLHSSKAGLLGRIASRIVKIPCIFTVHGWSFTEGIPSKQRKLFAFLERNTSFLCNKIITVSNYDTQLAIQEKICPPNKLLTIHNGIRDIPITKNINNNKIPVLVMVARFDEQKNQNLLIDTISELTNLEFTLKFIGDGPTLKQCQQKVKEKSLEKQIEFLGALKDVNSILMNSDIFILTSNWEGLPLTILEAMRASLPVIASDVGGVSEAVINGYNGFLIPKNDQTKLKESIEVLVNNPDLRHQMGANSRKLFEEHFTFNTMFEKTCNVYQQIIAKHN